MARNRDEIRPASDEWYRDWRHAELADPVAHRRATKREDRIVAAVLTLVIAGIIAAAIRA